MAARSPLRLLAPVALVLVFIALVVVVASSDGGSSGEATRERTTTTQREQPRRRTYVVKSGDTLLAIATKTGVGTARLLALNPGLDPQVLRPGQRLKLRP